MYLVDTNHQQALVDNQPIDEFLLKKILVQDILGGEENNNSTVV
jgi:hypothetical protein